MAELLISNNNLNTQQVGEVVDVKPDGQQWGNMEQPPNYAHITVTDATRVEAYTYLEEWKIKFQHQIVASTSNHWDINVSVDPTLISASGVGRSELKDDIVDFILNDAKWIEVEILGFSSNSISLRIPKNGIYRANNGLTKSQYRKVLRESFADVFDSVIDFRRYKFSPADVAIALSAAPGRLEVTKAQVANRIIDKLDL